MNKLNLCIVTLMVSGCSLVPYENEFSCQLEDNYGKCINVESAYEEAVTGVEQYPHMQKASERNRQARDEDAQEDQPKDDLDDEQRALVVDDRVHLRNVADEDLSARQRVVLAASLPFDRRGGPPYR